MAKSFNKTLHKGLSKIYDVDKYECDEKVPIVLWEYLMESKQSIEQPHLILYVVLLYFNMNAE